MAVVISESGPSETDSVFVSPSAMVRKSQRGQPHWSQEGVEDTWGGAEVSLARQHQPAAEP